MSYKFKKDSVDSIITGLTQKMKAYEWNEKLSIVIIILLCIITAVALLYNNDPAYKTEEYIGRAWNDLDELNAVHHVDLTVSAVDSLSTLYELKRDNLALLVELKEQEIRDHYIRSAMYKVTVFILAFLLIRIALNFQVYNTRRASYTRAVLTALKLYNEKGDLEKLVNIIHPEPYEHSAKVSDSFIEKIVSLIKSDN